MSDELQPGAHLGQYEIVRRLATGGMAEVYLAHRRGTAGFEKRVALKRILPGYAQDRAFVTMFLDEARLAATLRHANIASVFDVGAENHSYFFAMEFVHGQDVRAVRPKAWRQRYTLPLEIALAVATGTASALHYAHNKLDKRGASLHLVHRDISPSNILISYDGAVKLVDFGIARASSRSAAKTQTGLLRGKVPYLSPEQCRGQPLDARSDLFSLGTVLYELTTGVRPFRGESDFETMNQIVNSSAVPPTRVLDNYPPALESIVMTLLSPDRERRYQTAEALLADLERLSSDEELFVTDLVVAKYMREQFAAQLAAEMPEPPPPPPPPPEPTTSEWGVSPQAFSEPTRMYPDGVPSELMAAIGQKRMPLPLPDPEELPTLSEPEEPLPAFGAVPTSTDLVPTEVRTKPPRPPPRRSVPPPIAAERAWSEPEMLIERAPSEPRRAPSSDSEPPTSERAPRPPSAEPVPRGARAPSPEPRGARAPSPGARPPTDPAPRGARPSSPQPTAESRPSSPPPNAEPVPRARPTVPPPPSPDARAARPSVPPPIAEPRATRPSVAPPIAESRTTRPSVAPMIAEARTTRSSVAPPINDPSTRGPGAPLAEARTTRPSVAPPIAGTPPPIPERAGRPSVPPPIGEPARRARVSTPPPTIADAVKAALLPPPLAINIRPTRDLPKKPPEDDLAIPVAGGGVVVSTFQHESSGIVLPFDPIDARSAEILDAVEASVPVAQHISAFLERAKTWFELGDLERAVSAIDLAMAEPSNAPLLEPHLDLIVRTFDAFLGPLDSQLVLAHALEELANVPLSPRAAFLLSRIDGSTTIEELLDISGMPRLEAKRYLCQLFLRGVVSR